MKADIALLLEGTYPFVSGGVSSWVHQIIRAFPEWRFHLVFLGSRREDYAGMRYELPPNVVGLEIHYLFEPEAPPPLKAPEPSPQVMGQVEAVHEAFLAGVPVEEAMTRLVGLFPVLLSGEALRREHFLRSRAAWESICSRYRRFCTDPSFVDYFWTVRIMHAPLWKLSAIARSLPKARVYHTISTGYAGFLGALLHWRDGRPLILSEHGIYTKERKIDLLKAEWIRDNRNVFQRDPTEVSYFRALWIRFFEWLGRTCYQAADPIIALYEANRQRQIQDGADAARTRLIPNGVDLARFRPLRSQRPARVPPVLCLIGRVVPIKDVKTFIRAMRRVVNVLPEAEGWIAGPEDEDPGYAEECRNLVESLGLAGKVRFLGFQKVDALLPRVGLTILSSISEALPLVILEGFAAGVPTVATDVGSCRQLVEGLPGEDRALGTAGAIVGIADPLALADAAVALLTDEARWRAASAAAIARVERFYTDEMMFAAYREVYGAAMEKH
ncbi:MAG: GT4 family glycosyltransferase PelF [Burkholderiales bacterium]|nr:GT4 family glycosyltransferase PelF [Burkholderiales bacterium]